MQQSNHIKEYLQGSQRGPAANRLEREALADPFLFEAMEGLSSAPGDPLEGILRLERELGARQRPITTRANKWYRVAACIIVLAGLALWGVPKLQRIEWNTLLLAKQNESPRDRRQNVTPPANPETNRESLTEFPPPDENTAKANRDILPSASTGISDEVAPDEHADPKEHVPMPEKDEKSATARVATPPPATDKKPENKTVETVAETRGNPLRDTTTSSEDAPERETLPDLSAAIDSTHAPLQLAHAGTQTQTRQLAEADTSLTTHLDENAPAEPEAMALDRTTKEQEKLPPSPDALTHAVERDVDRFNRHARETLRYPSTAVKRSEEGKIYLSFSVTPDGHPDNVRVINDFSSKECTRELLRLLQTSPKWLHTPPGRKLYYIARFEIGQDGPPHRLQLSFIASDSE
jgi:outer membrane biosynthesis protein TonB